MPNLAQPHPLKHARGWISFHLLGDRLDGVRQRHQALIRLCLVSAQLFNEGCRIRIAHPWLLSVEERVHTRIGIVPQLRWLDIDAPNGIHTIWAGSVSG